MFRNVLVVLLVLVCTVSALAQDRPLPVPDTSVATADALLPDGFDAARPPELPSTVSRDDTGRVTVRAVRLTQPIRLDGALDEDYYRTLTPISDFIQVEPIPDAPATEKTEVWILFDSDNVYVSMRATESDPSRMIANEMRRDSFNILQNDNFFFGFDTFYDKRNSFGFQFNPLGGRMDGQVSNENSFASDFNPVWRVYTRRTADGWTAEAMVPFKSMRFQPGQTQIWGFQARRINRWKNETSFLTSLPAGLGTGGIMRVSRYATMVGLETPAGSSALDIKPYVISSLNSDVRTGQSNELKGDFGFDTKYALTQTITADFTYKTDFAQVEADDQQVNLTRFSLFFPEKRDFFLENQGTFIFANTNGGNGDAPTLFYSRRIGLAGGEPIPLDVGGRVSGRLGKYSIGLLSIKTGEVEATPTSSAVFPATLFNTFRLRRDVLRRSAVGLLYTGRSKATLGDGSAETFGVDGNWAFYQNLFFNTYWAKTSTPGLNDKDISYRAQMNYNADRYGAQVEWLHIGDNFNPEIGFVRRDNFTKRRLMFRFSPRTQNRFRAVRKFGYQVAAETFENPQGQMETRQRRGEFYADFQNSNRVQVNFDDSYELILRPFDIAGVTIPPGSYDNRTLELSYQVGQQSVVSGTGSLERGPFYGGMRTAYGFNGRIRVSSRIGIEPNIQLNVGDLPVGDFTTTLVASRLTYAITPLSFVSGLLQYNSSNSSFSSNVRLRWEYTPGSELFVVYNDSRDTSLAGGVPSLQNRSLVFKINKLFRF
jgi:hypothetical protein